MPGVREEDRHLAAVELLDVGEGRAGLRPAQGALDVAVGEDVVEDALRLRAQPGLRGRVEQGPYGRDVPGGVLVEGLAEVAPGAECDHGVHAGVVRGDELADT
ncbi:hypothetical protein Snoj_83300 [Streptomyces nojiriensis]|uniref:Uncharacterized protein n=1 Tax=Streptomyces nojiriensis TaxID=66374 RepID=A0ABQ3T1Z7_9ACTN|nr:hypothetical protein Snoj_83300 [Streptomyces nojiriensis]